jgi:hypothetical protein
MKVIRIALSIPLILLAGVAGVAGFLSLILACVISVLADRVYGGSLSHDAMTWHLSSSDKRTDTDYRTTSGPAGDPDLGVTPQP